MDSDCNHEIKRRWFLGRKAMTNLDVRVCCCFSCIQLFATPWTVAHEAPLSVGFSRQEYWSGLPFPPPRNRTHIAPGCPALQADFLLLSHLGSLRFLFFFQYLFLFYLFIFSCLCQVLVVACGIFSHGMWCLIP